MPHNRNSSYKFAAIFASALAAFTLMASLDARADAQTRTGFEGLAEQSAFLTLGSNRALTYLTACDLTSIGIGSRVGATAICSVRAYAGDAGNFKAYQATVQTVCTEFQGCKVGG
ncbi:MAG: hypothetical protein E6Q85_09510 [Thiothrix sp.]|nr:MAG: hypothetical protein E6Q85_09510 [Thiothrix sp.]